MTIKDNTGAEVSEVKVLKAYFGFQQEQTLTQFMAEVKTLTPENKTELAVLAAKELGYTVE